MESFGEIDMRCHGIFEAEYLIALFTEEMRVHIVDRTMMIAVADFIFGYSAAILNCVYDVMLQKEIQHAQNTGTFEGSQLRFNLNET